MRVNLRKKVMPRICTIQIDVLSFFHHNRTEHKILGQYASFYNINFPLTQKMKKKGGKRVNF